MPTKFEVWKDGLTIASETERRKSDKDGTICYDCPAKDYCDAINANKSIDCGKTFKEWGESDAN